MAFSAASTPAPGVFEPAPQLEKSPVITRGNLTLAIRTGSACDFFRVTMPFMLGDMAPKVPVLVFNRLPTMGIDRVRIAQANGMKVVVDIDDHFVLDHDHSMARIYAHLGQSAMIEECVRLADLVLVTTPVLADEIRPYAKRVEVVPNALPFDEGIFSRAPETESGTTFVWAGGSTHRLDLNLIRNTGRLSDLTIGGYDVRHPEWKQIRKTFSGAVFRGGINLPDFKAFQLRNGHGEWSYGPWPDYMSLLNGHRAALAPLRETPFNACKSNLKVLEAGAKGIPIIASDVLPYANDLDRDAVIFAKTADDWRKQMKLIKESRAYAEDRGEKLAEHVRNHYSLKDANELRRQIFESLN